MSFASHFKARGVKSIEEAVMPRKSKYTEEIATEILERLEGGETLKSILKASHMPTYKTVMNWTRSFEDFKKNYRTARENQMHFWIDSAMDEALQSVEFFIESDRYLKKLEGAEKKIAMNTKIQLIRERNQMLRNLCSKVAPNLYSEKMNHEMKHKGDGEVQVIIKNFADE